MCRFNSGFNIDISMIIIPRFSDYILRCERLVPVEQMNAGGACSFSGSLCSFQTLEEAETDGCVDKSGVKVKLCGE